MFKRYMIVLAALAVLFLTSFYWFNEKSGDIVAAIEAETAQCETLTSLDKQLECVSAVNKSLLWDKGFQLDRAMGFAAYACAFTFLIMIVSWVVRWVWKGRKK